MSYILPCAACFAGPLLMVAMTWLCDWSAKQSPVYTDVKPWGDDA